MKRLHTLLLRMFFAALLAGCGSAMAAGVDLVGDDTDLFTTNPAIPAQVPNVLFVVDNTASWDNAANGWQGDATHSGLDAACVSAGMPGSGKQIKQGDAEMCAI